MTHPTLRTESLLQLTWPIFLQQTTQGLVVLVDFWFFGHLSDAVAGTVSQLLPLVLMGTYVIPVFAGAGVAVGSQYMGAGQFEKVVPTYMMNLLLSAGLGTLFAATMHFFAGDIGRWMGMDAGLNAISATYLSSISAYFVFMGVLAAYNAILSSRGMTHWLMYSSFLVASLNLLLASLFVFVFHWQVGGIALASVISVASATLLSIWLVHVRLQVRFRFKGIWREMCGVLPPLLRIGVANALEPFCYTVQQTILSTMIISLGVVSMAANGYSGRVQVFQITFGLSLGLGSQILMGHWMGAERFDDVDRLYWKVIRRAAAVAIVYAVGAWLLSDWALGFFTQDPEVKALGKTLLLIAVFTEPARAVNIITSFTLKTVGDARFPLVVGILFIWGILPVVVLINRTWGMSLAGFWMCFAADELIRACINLSRWHTRKWQNMGITRKADTLPGAGGVSLP